MSKRLRGLSALGAAVVALTPVLALPTPVEARVGDVPATTAGSERQHLTGASRVAVLHDSSLAGIDGVSAHDVWAVGYHADGGFRNSIPLTLHYGGHKWRTVPSPRVDGVLAAVTAVASDDVWAVGQTYTGGGTDTLAIHWNGRSWAQVPVPSGFAQYNTLTDVTATGPDNVLAIGRFSSGEGDPQPISLTWDGTAWHDSGASLEGVYEIDAVSADDAWAVGQTDEAQTLIKHWNGQHWRRVASPDVGDDDSLRQVTAISSDDVWATGFSTTTPRSFTEHWDGTSWTVEATGLTDDIAPTGISGSAAGDVWMSVFSTQNALLEHWTGHAWETVDSPASQHPEPRLEDVVTFSRDNAWAVGAWYYCFDGMYCYDQRIIVHWNGKVWENYHRP